MKALLLKNRLLAATWLACHVALSHSTACMFFLWDFRWSTGIFRLGFSKLHGLSMFAVKAKIYGVIYNQSRSIAFDETSSCWSEQKAPYFSAFHWSPHGSLISIGQHFVTTRVMHLPKRTETSLITESDRSGPNHRVGPGCVVRA